MLDISSHILNGSKLCCNIKRVLLTYTSYSLSYIIVEYILDRTESVTDANQTSEKLTVLAEGDDSQYLSVLGKQLTNISHIQQSTY